MQWTDWKSASDAKNGNDFEILGDHIKLFGLVLDLSFESTDKLQTQQIGFKSLCTSNAY